MVYVVLFSTSPKIFLCVLSTNSTKSCKIVIVIELVYKFPADIVSGLKNVTSALGSSTCITPDFVFPSV